MPTPLPVMPIIPWLVLLRVQLVTLLQQPMLQATPPMLQTTLLVLRKPLAAKESWSGNSGIVNFITSSPMGNIGDDEVSHYSNV